MANPDWIVLRFSPECPPELVPEELEGHWFDRSVLHGKVELTRSVPATRLDDLGTRVTRQSVARPTGKFEVDDNMQVAEVYEVELWAA
jgi:hypothetical protein